MLTIDFEELKCLKEIKFLIYKHGLVIVKNTDLSLENFDLFINTLGEPLSVKKHYLNKNRTVQNVSNTGLFSNNYVEWHNDWSYGTGDYFGTALYNAYNADLATTSFVDMSKLPDFFYNFYKNKKASYELPPSLSSCVTSAQFKFINKIKKERPMVFNHPITKEKLLYCSPGTIVNPPSYLYKLIRYVENIKYDHIWQKNDLLLIDNLKMMHKRQSFVGSRILWRIQFNLFSPHCVYE